MKHLITSIFLALILVAPASGQPLVQASDITYEGSFRLPATCGSDNLYYGGTALSRSPAGLYITTLAQRAGEVSIPPVGGTATALFPCTDIPDLRVSFSDPRLGSIVNINGKIILSAYAYYDAAGTQKKSHAVFGQPFQQVGKGGAFTSTYMTYVPVEWQGRLGFDILTGGCCTAIISRTNYGYGMSGMSSSTLTAQELVSYPASAPLGQYNVQSLIWNISTSVGGMVFPDGTSSVLFITQQGTTTPCYGSAANCPNTGGSPYSGYHAAPYVTQVVAYDANDLLRVKAGILAPTSVRPYARWPLPALTRAPAGAAWDPSTSRIYVTERYGDDPRVHVFKLTVAPPAETFTFIIPASTVTHTIPAETINIPVPARTITCVRPPSGAWSCQ